MHSCIYEGRVTHRRQQPVVHAFQYDLFMIYLDLQELPELIDRHALFTTSKHSQRAFLREDHLFQHRLPLDEELRRLIHAQTGQRPTGPIRLLTQLRYFGFYLSPLNLYYVFDEQDTQVQCIVAEVNNTPWNERHCYVLSDSICTRRQGDTLRFAHPKQFHVSPFLDMQIEYRWQLSVPAHDLKVQIANHADGQPVFNAAMTLQRRELNAAHLRRMTLHYPWMTVQIAAGIYYQALQLWWKQCPFYPHPKTQCPQS